MAQKIDLIELYLPDCVPSRAGVLPNPPKLAGWNFLLNMATQVACDLKADEQISQYFFSNTISPIPHAALCAYFCDLEKAHWIKADPVKYSLDISHGFILPCEVKLDNDNHGNLISDLNQFLSQDGLSLKVIDQHNWLIGSQKPINYDVPNLVNIVNQEVYFDQISGKDKIFWQKLSAELQLLLRQKKTSEEDPDGVYFWGAGELPQVKPKTQFSKIISNNYAILGLAKLAGVDFEQIDFKQPIDFFDFQSNNHNSNNSILVATQDFSLNWRLGKIEEYGELLVFFDKMLLELIKLIKIGTLKKLIINTGEFNYQLTKCNIIKSYFLKYFKPKNLYK
jgi:hypothetical protein